jgi:radical SAM-linked protein
VTALTDPAPEAKAAPSPTPVPPFEPRQRWRLAFAREQPPGDEVPTGREYIGRWEETVVAAGLPAVTVASGRPRIALGAALPTGCSAERELLELWLTAVRPAWVVRESLEPVLPGGHRLMDLENVWIGAPALSGQVAAADYLVTLGTGDHIGGDVDAAAGRLLAANRLPRERRKGGETRTYDLRPLIVRLEAHEGELRMRTRIHPELGTGRPDEVVAALADELGEPLSVERIVRSRLLLADELGD